MRPDLTAEMVDFTLGLAMNKGTEGAVKRKSVRRVVGPKRVRAAKAAGGPGHEEIAARAYAIYLAEGRPEGHAEEHWSRAEAELLGRGAQADRTLD